MEYKLTNNEPFILNSYTNNVHQSVDLARDIVTADDPISYSYVIPYKSPEVRQIYTSVRHLHINNNERDDVLCVEGAESLLNNNYVPVLFRRVKTRNRGWKWQHYGPGSKSPNFITVSQGELCDFTPMHEDQPIPVFNYIKIRGVAGKNGFPQPHFHSDGERVLVSHGTRQYFLLDDGDDAMETHNFTARWGLAFIKLEDFPNNHTALDMSKLVTNIAPFFIYYQAAHVSGGNIYANMNIIA